MNQSPVSFADAADPAMQQAFQQARQTFRYFYRELCWERRRIVPGLASAYVKIIFDDPTPHRQGAELMWCDKVSFDGLKVRGRLLNEPSWLKSVHQGDAVAVNPSELTDWMYVIGQRVFGGFTVQVLRARMSRTERQQHDEAWGLDFGKPGEVHVVPPEFLRSKPGLFSGWLRGGPAPLTAAQLETTEHPMALNMGESLTELLTKSPERVRESDDEGLTLLHQLALAGTTSGCEILLKHGADPNARSRNGMTPLGLAKSLGWQNVAALLTRYGAKP